MQIKFSQNKCNDASNDFVPVYKNYILGTRTPIVNFKDFEEVGKI